MNLEPMQKAAVLIEALPYIQRFNRKIVVVKYGGSVLTQLYLLYILYIYSYNILSEVKT